jgi:valyl-tRNA synthetase
VLDGGLLPDEAQLPVDPSSQPPPGFDETQRGQPNGFIGEADVMDTWATSSLTPQIAGGWEDDPELFRRVFPMDLRPQAHEIIRTWLFSTIVRSEIEHRELPWKQVCISGWVLNPEKEKMSKSKDNALSPQHLLERYGADAVRYWAACARPGVDTLFDEGQMKIGRRLALKVLNASKFIVSRCGPRAAGPITELLDRAMLGRLAELVDEATASFESFDYARALQKTEAFFWRFCDDYLELVKNRSYADAGTPSTASAHAALLVALSTQLRLLAPVLPFAAEEAWSWWNEGSIHRAPWPEAATLRDAGALTSPVYDEAALLLGAIRKAKSEASLSVKAPLARVRLSAPLERKADLAAVLSDVKDAANAGEVTVEVGELSARIEAGP